MSEPSLGPYVPSSEDMAWQMLMLADLRQGDILYDLGSGDGRVVIMAARNFYGVKAVGIEMRDDLVKESRKKIQDFNLEDQVKVIHGDVMEVDFSEADVVSFYLTEDGIALLKPKLEKNVKPGCRILSTGFRIPNWEPAEVSVGLYKIYLYVR